MRAIFILQFLAFAEIDSCPDESDEVCLLQHRSFLEGKQERARNAALFKSGEPDMPADSWEFFQYHVMGIKTQECPGKEFVALTMPGVCTYVGAEMLYTGKDETPKVYLKDWFGDNVMIKHLKYEYTDPITTNQVELISPTVSEHHWGEGNWTVVVTGYDLSMNWAECHRTIWIRDKEKPEFVTRPEDVDGAFTKELDENCQLSATEVINEYEMGGWVRDATDNCHNAWVEVGIKNSDDSLVWHSHDAAFVGVDPDNTYLAEGPGSYKLVYTAYDMHSNYRVHEVAFTGIDGTAPTEFSACPSDMEYILEAHVNTKVVDWTVPFVSADNCLAFGEFPVAVEQSQPPKHPGQEFPVGVHHVSYVLADPAGMEMDHECSFTITIKQKAHLVDLTCPPNQIVDTVTDAGFGLPTWPDPVAMQGPVQLDSSSIAIAHGVESGMPFPYGTTVVKVNATGQITGERVEEEERYAECEFNVTVLDPQDPEVDGRLYRCHEGAVTSHTVEPYGVCIGKKIAPHLHDGYYSTGMYDIVGTITNMMTADTAGTCCNNEMNTPHHCVTVPDQSKVSYCVPTSSK
jgi:hypothetical protein